MGNQGAGGNRPAGAGDDAGGRSLRERRDAQCPWQDRDVGGAGASAVNLGGSDAGHF